MKAREVRDFNSAELQHKHQELIEELFNLRFQLATGQIENVGVLLPCGEILHASKRCNASVNCRPPHRTHKVAGYGRGSKESFAGRSD